MGEDSLVPILLGALAALLCVAGSSAILVVVFLLNRRPGPTGEGPSASDPRAAPAPPPGPASAPPPARAPAAALSNLPGEARGDGVQDEDEMPTVVVATGPSGGLPGRTQELPQEEEVEEAAPETPDPAAARRSAGATIIAFDDFDDDDEDDDLL